MTVKQMKIYIDDREDGDRIKSAINFFLSNDFVLGENLNVIHLRYGDYIFRENGINVIFEYKTIDDFVASLSDYRVFNQAINQSNNFDYHFVIIVGSENDRIKTLKKNAHFSGSYTNDKQYYGAIASLVNFTSVIQVPTEELSFQVMLQIAEHCIDLKPVLKRYPKSRGSPALRILTNNIDGIGLKKAERICETLKLFSVLDVISLNTEKLVKVHGIGKKGAEDLIEQIKGEYGFFKQK